MYCEEWVSSGCQDRVTTSPDQVCTFDPFVSVSSHDCASYTANPETAAGADLFAVLSIQRT